MIGALPKMVDYSAIEELCVLKPGELSRVWQRKAYESLTHGGIAAPPTLVFDVVTAAHERRLVRAWPRGRHSPGHAFDRMRDVHDALRGSHRSFISMDDAALKTRMQNALGFLRAWLSTCPADAGKGEPIESLERAALGFAVEAQKQSSEWLAWRAAEEHAFETGGSQAFQRALAALRAGSPIGFSCTDEGIWHASGGELTAPGLLEFTSSQKRGEDGEPVRDHSGPFHEVDTFTIPPDPTRLVASDLSLLAATEPSARRLLAVKISDSSFMVRFGSRPRPSRRRARVLFVAALEDDLTHHVQSEHSLLPEIDFLRESLLQALPHFLRLLADLHIDPEVEIRREGPLRRKRLRIPDIRGKSGRLHPSLASFEAIRSRLGRDDAWIFDDSPSDDRKAPRPMLDGFDGAVLFTVGAHSKLPACGDWTAHLGIESDPKGRRVHAHGMVSGASTIQIKDVGAKELGAQLAQRLGTLSDVVNLTSNPARSWQATDLT